MTLTISSIRHIMKEQQLAIWATEQTFAYWSNQLTDEQIQQLEQLPLWSWRHYLPKKLQKHTDTYIRRWFEKQMTKSP